jgi:hypothetical protein
MTTIDHVKWYYYRVFHDYNIYNPENGMSDWQDNVITTFENICNKYMKPEIQNVKYNKQTREITFNKDGQKIFTSPLNFMVNILNIPLDELCTEFAKLELEYL